jgi:thymidylate synthase (FAD)
MDEAGLYPTKRTTVPAMEALLRVELPVLDHGFVRVVDYMGDDAAVIQAARVSYGSGTKTLRQDSALISYLMRNKHTTPFEMCELKLHVRLPIFVARQWIRHRTASVNEYSARYSMLDREFYFPMPEHVASQSLKNKQGREGVLPSADAMRVIEILHEDANRNYDHYLNLIGEGEGDAYSGPGVSRELARINLTLNAYTQWYWKIDLHNLMNFVALRADEHAQFEIREYARRMLEIMKAWVPMSHAAFTEHRLESIQLSSREIKVLKKALNGQVLRRDKTIAERDWMRLEKTFGFNSED